MSKQLTDNTIKLQANRLLALPNMDEPKAHEAAKALKRHCQSDFHVQRTVQYLLDNAQFFPTPSAIRDAAEICPVKAPPKFRPAQKDCGVCSGRGLMWMADRGDGYSGAGPCDCRRVPA